MQTSTVTEVKKHKTGWFLRYLPFIARPQHLQIEWLVSECKKSTLSNEELLPYVRLLFDLESSDEKRSLKENLKGLDCNIICRILGAADVYIVAKVVTLIPELNHRLAEVVLVKEMPPYEQKPQKIMDDVFYAINHCASGLLEDVATLLVREKRAPKGFKENYARFKAILADEEFIRKQWPSAK